MPSERAIVETLNRKELLDLVTHFDLQVGDRRVRDNLVDALASSRRTRIDKILQQLSVTSLKEVCRKHGIDDSGRLKAQLIDRILNDSAGKAARKGAAAKKAEKPAKVAKGKAGSAPVAKTKGGAAKAKPVAAKAAKVAKAKPVAAKAAKVAKAKPVAAKAAKVAKAKPVAAKAAKVAKAVKAAPVAKASKAAPVAKKAVAAKAKLVPAKSVAAKGKPAVMEPTAKEAAPKNAAATKAPPAKVTPVNIPPLNIAAEPAAKANVIELSRATKPVVPAPAKNGSSGSSHVQAVPEAAKVIKAVPPRVVPNPNKQAANQPPAAPAPVPASPMVAQPISPEDKPRPFGVQMTAKAVREALANAPQPLPLLPEMGTFVPTSGTKACHACGTKLDLRKCGVQRCRNMLVASPTRKICAECLFERNTLSMDEFNQRLEEEARCPHCNDAWQDN